VVKVKVEKPGDGGSDEDEGGGRGTGHCNDTVRVANCIYKKAYKRLKLKLYFENLFQTDDEKDSRTVVARLPGAQKPALRPIAVFSRPLVHHNPQGWQHLWTERRCGSWLRSIRAFINIVGSHLLSRFK